MHGVCKYISFSLSVLYQVLAHNLLLVQDFHGKQVACFNFASISHDIQLFDDDGEKMVDLAAFDTLMRKELRSFAQRSLAQCIRKTPDVHAQILLGTMKMLLVDSRTTQNMLLSDAQSALGPAKVSERLRSRSPARSRSPQLMRCDLCMVQACSRRPDMRFAALT